MRHKEKVVIAVFFQYGRQSRIARNDRAFHQVPFHHSRKRIQGGIQTMVRMDSCRIEIAETDRTGIQAIQERSQSLRLPEMLHKLGGHRLHHNQDDIRTALLHAIRFCSMPVNSQRGNIRISRTVEQSLRLGDGFLFIHQMQVFIFRSHIIHHTRQQVKSRTYSQLIEKSILTEICRTYFDRVIACTPPDSKDAESD